MAVSEVLNGGADSLKGVGTAAIGVVAGLGATLKMHETVEQDQQAIVLNRGKVKLDRSQIKEEWGISNMRRARRLLAAYAVAHGLRELDVMAEYADVRDSGSLFTFFNVRAVRKIETNDLTNTLPDQRITLTKGLCTLEHALTWRVEPEGKNAVRALLRARNMTEVSQKVISSAAAGAREVVISLDAEKQGGAIISSEVFKGIQELCAPKLERNYGVGLLDYDLLGLEPTPDEKNRRIIFEGPDGLPIPPAEIGGVALAAAASHVVSGDRETLHAVGE
jgi:hypothetical protein